MIIGLSPIPRASHILGYPINGEVFGSEEQSDQFQGLRQFFHNLVTDGTAITPADLKINHYINGVHTTLSSDPVVVTDKLNVRSVHAIVGYEKKELGLFEIEFGAMTGDGIRVTWPINTEPDFGYYELYWDNAQAGLTVGEFYKYATVHDESSNTLVVHNLSTGTYRFYIKYYDIYGNGGPSVPDVYSVNVLADLTLAGTFAFTSSDNHVFVEFTTSASTGVAQVFVFANIIPGLGVVDYVSAEYPFMRVGEVRSLPEGQIKLFAIGFDNNGNASNIVSVSKTVVIIDDVYYIEDPLIQPLDIESLTLAAGLFRLQFDAVEHATWETVEIKMFDEDDVEVFTDTFANLNLTSQSFDIDPDLTDGNYTLQMRVSKTFVYGTIYTDWSDPVSVIIDATYPAGETTLSLELINE